MRKGILKGLLDLLVPSGLLAWTARLMLWCSAYFLIQTLVKFILGQPIHFGWDIIVVALSGAPLFLLAMALARNQNTDLQNMTRIAKTDKLTGLMNRRAFFEVVDASGDGALLVLDIDHFKQVNDRYGHVAGDAVLVAMADHLRRNIRSGDLLGRIGGEEFGLFLFGADSLEVDSIGKRLCEGFVLYNDKVPAPIKVTMSIGAAYSAMSDDTEALYKNADEALYAAKRSGRARLTFWQPASSGRN